MNRVAVAPGMLAWACERAGFSITSLEKRYPRLAAWDSGEVRPTLEPYWFL